MRVFNDEEEFKNLLTEFHQLILLKYIFNKDEAVGRFINKFNDEHGRKFLDKGVRDKFKRAMFMILK